MGQEMHCVISVKLMCLLNGHLSQLLVERLKCGLSYGHDIQDDFFIGSIIVFNGQD